MFATGQTAYRRPVPVAAFGHDLRGVEAHVGTPSVNLANCSSYVAASPATVRWCRAGPLRLQAIAGVRYTAPATVPP